MLAELTQEEQKQIQEATSEELEQKAKQLAIMICYFVNAFRGRPPGEKEHIDKLVNLDKILERSRFPTYPILREQVYCRLVSHLNQNYKSYEDYADFMAEALIQYKGEGRTEYVEALKKVAPSEPTNFFFGVPSSRGETQPQPKRRFWQRKPKEEMEFEQQ